MTKRCRYQDHNFDQRYDANKFDSDCLNCVFFFNVNFFLDWKRKQDKKCMFNSLKKKSKDKNILFNEEINVNEIISTSALHAYIGILKILLEQNNNEIKEFSKTKSDFFEKIIETNFSYHTNWMNCMFAFIVKKYKISEDEKEIFETFIKTDVKIEDLKTVLLNSKNYKENKELPKLNYILLYDLLYLIFIFGFYTGKSRGLIKKFAQLFDIDTIKLGFLEEIVQNEIKNQELQNCNSEKLKLEENYETQIKKRLTNEKTKKAVYIGLATACGSVAVGLSVGLLSPFIGAGIATGLSFLGIGGTAGFFSGTIATTLMTTSGVVIGAKVGSSSTINRVLGVKIFEFKPINVNGKKNVVLCSTGWILNESDDVRSPFLCLDPVMGDLYSLNWEPKILESMGKSIRILTNQTLSFSIYTILGQTALSTLISAILLPLSLISLFSLLDNPWSLALDKAWKSGKVLADVLMKDEFKLKSISLIGFSIGSFLIYSCLLELSKNGIYGLIDDVVIIGSPISVKVDQLKMVRQIVNGRFVNCYSKNDWILGLLFRALKNGLSDVAGLSPINNGTNIENFDCSEFINGHMCYRKKIPTILNLINWKTNESDDNNSYITHLNSSANEKKIISSLNNDPSSRLNTNEKNYESSDHLTVTLLSDKAFSTSISNPVVVDDPLSIDFIQIKNEIEKLNLNP